MVREVVSGSLAWVSLLARIALASGIAVGLLAFLGFAPSVLLCTGRLRPVRLALAPLLGWAILSGGCYLLLVRWSFARVLPLLLAAAALANGGIALWAVRGSRRRWGAWLKELLALVPIALTAAVVLIVGLLPQLHHGTLTLLVPNQDDEYFVELVDQFWAAPAGARLTPGAFRIETGWAYHLLLAAMRLTGALDPFEAVTVGSMLALALAVPPTLAFFQHELRLPRSWALLGTLAANLHGLVLWVPGYGFGPNAAAVAAAPLAYLALGRAVRLRSARAVILGGLSVGLVLMAYTKVSALLVMFTATGMCLAIGAWGRARAGHRRLALARLLVTILLGGVVGGYALFDAAAWGWGTYGSLLFSAQDTTGAGWGLTTFPPLDVWLGVAAWSFIMPATPRILNAGIAAVATAGMAAAVLLVAAGAISLRHRGYAPVLGMLLGSALFVLYARYLKEFPYAVFKVYTLTAVLVVGVCLRGAWKLHATAAPVRASSRGNRPYAVAMAWWRQPGAFARRWPRLGPTLARLSMACYTLALAGASWQTLRFYWQPWGPLLGPEALAEAARISQAIPRGATAIISDQFRLPAPAETAGVRPHPVAFHSLWQAQRDGAARLRSVLSRDLRAAGISVQGIFTHAGGYTVALPAPASEHGEYLILGTDEDPRLYGIDPLQRVMRGEYLSLYRRSPPGRLDLHALSELFQQAGSGTVQLSIGCDGRLLPLGVNGRPGQQACGTAQLALGLLATGTGPIDLSVETPNEHAHLPLYLASGFTWYRTPRLAMPATLTFSVVQETSGNAEAEPRLLFVAGGTVLPEGTGAAPDVQHLQSGALLANLRLEDGAVVVTIVSAAPAAPPRLQVSLATTAIGPGLSYATDADTGKPLQVWQWRVQPGAPIEQQIDGRAVPMPGSPMWPAAGGQSWFRLQLHRGDLQWQDVPLGFAQARDGLFSDLTQVTVLAGVPSPEAAPSPPPLPPQGTLVKGSGAAVFLVDGGRLRWIPTPDLFAVHHWVWEDVRTVDDSLLAQWPYGLPVR